MFKTSVWWLSIGSAGDVYMCASVCVSSVFVWV